mmetsp:Transcript_18370/g.47039  ORF Transcript_18370/g.47039 Transcript_18370/m.47039 type:complete len:236 (-) Transcript_18370:522-1229(-)
MSSGGAEELASAVCDALVAGGKLKAKPEFIRKDREAKIVKVFEAAKLGKTSLETMNGRAVEVNVRKATEGEAWVDDVIAALKGMLSDEAANDTKGPTESDEMKALREKIVENAKVEFADGAPPPNPSGPGGRARGGDDESYGNFGGRGGGGPGGGGRACYNCGEEGHMSRDCPQPRQGGGGGGGGGDCYNCGKPGHQSRDCPEPRRDGGGGRGGGACYNCGQEGHQSRDCPEPRR